MKPIDLEVPMETKVILALDKHLEKIVWDMDKTFKNHKCAEVNSITQKVYDCGKIHGMESIIRNMKQLNLSYLGKQKF